MSRSCQSATFSSPTTAAPRTTRARPQIRSATTGLRLCGIADEPFCPRPNGSPTSATSVRARCRTSSANFSSEAATSVSADGTGELADAHAVERAHEALAAALKLERPPGELEPEGRRLGVDAVSAPDRQRRPVFLRPSDDGFERAVDARQEQPAGLLHLEREGGVEDVGGGEPVVEPAALVAEL